MDFDISVPKQSLAKTKLKNISQKKAPAPLFQKKAGTAKPLASLVNIKVTARKLYSYIYGPVVKLALVSFVLVTLIIAGPVKAITADSFVYVNGYPTLNGNFVDCYGNIDNDPAHHTTNQNDTDPAHHSGQNCPAGSPVALALGGQATAQTENTKVQQVSQVNASPNNTLEVSFPTEGAIMGSATAFKAVIKNLPLVSYEIFWQVDGDVLNVMKDSYEGAAHKEAYVDASKWNWKGKGPYVVNFVAKGEQGQVLATKSVQIFSSVSSGTSPTAPTTSATTPTAPAQQGSFSSVGLTSVPLATANFYRDPNSNAVRQANEWRSSRPNDAALMDKIASQPNAIWLGGWNSNVKNDVANIMNAAKAQGTTPIFILYNLPYRDCGGYSAGGTSEQAYKNWISDVAAGLGGGKAIIVLEPDGIALTTCLSGPQLQNRYDLLQSAVASLKATGSAVYLDAGHPNWIEANDMAGRLKNAGVDKADGFALNISNFTTTEDNLKYGQTISSQTGGKHFIVDTSRNGKGPAGSEWCNPAGRGLGSKPTTNTGNPLVDAFIWGKDPGGSDGNCNGGPNAGVFWAEYALGLAQRSSW